MIVTMINIIVTSNNNIWLLIVKSLSEYYSRNNCCNDNCCFADNCCVEDCCCGPLNEGRWGITVKGGVPPEILMGSGSGASPCIADSSRLAPFGGNTICSGRVKLADATACGWKR